MYLKLEPAAGEDIKEAAEIACRVYKRLGVTVEFVFNGITLYANEKWTYDVILNEYGCAIRSGERKEVMG